MKFTQRVFSLFLTLLLVCAFTLTSAVFAVVNLQAQTDKSTYAPGETVKVTVTSPAQWDIVMKVIDGNGSIFHTDAKSAKSNSTGNTTLTFTLGSWVGQYTIVVGGNGNSTSSITASPMVIKVATVGGGGGGGGFGGPVTTIDPDQIVKITNSLKLINNSNASDKEIQEAINTASEQLNKILTELTTLTDPDKSKQVLQSILDNLTLMASLSSKVSAVNQSIALTEKIIPLAGSVRKLTNDQGLSDDSKLMTTVIDLVNSINQKAGTLDSTQFKMNTSGKETKIVVDADALQKQIQSADQTTNALSNLLNQNHFSDLANKLEKQVIINVSKDTSVGDITNVTIPSSGLSDLKTKNVDLVVNVDGVVLKFSPDSLPVVDSNKVKSIEVRVSQPTDSKSLLDKKPSFADTINVPVNDLNVSSKKDDNTETLLNNQFGDKIVISMSLNGVDKSKVDVNQIAPQYFNPTTGKWELVPGGKYNEKTNSIEFSVSHFSTYTLMQINKSFDDVQGRWSETYVSQAFAKGIVTGRSDSLFDPTANVTRAEFAVMLSNTLGLTTSSSIMPFKDVATDAWYAKEVASVYKAGFIDGVTSEQFAPNAKITREQMATMIGRALEKVKNTKTVTNADSSKILTLFSDRKEISEWATNYMALSVREGLLSGTSDTTLSPSQVASREQAAKVMLILFEK
ncbi:S-layer homology domain-containing protein [Paenibacillus sp. 2RAB27]|uniref:S-layer homology domain-containing protein n=1 Tax=Paenibacillus sp. 2RAB27 TaxID=3232991 RepID=UPI003F9CB430